MEVRPYSAETALETVPVEAQIFVAPYLDQSPVAPEACLVHEAAVYRAAGAAEVVVLCNSATKALARLQGQGALRSRLDLVRIERGLSVDSSATMALARLLKACCPTATMALVLVRIMISRFLFLLDSHLGTPAPWQGQVPD
jgi:hypothetical protein